MAKTATSTLIVRLLDKASAPARVISKSLTGITKSAGGFGQSLGSAIERNNAALANARGSLVDAAAGFFILKKAIGGPILAASEFETVLEDIGQKLDMPQSKFAALGKSIRALARDTTQTAAQVALGVDVLAGMGANEQDALAMMPNIGKAATAYRAEITHLAQAGYAALDNLKVPASEFGKALDAMAQAGKAGAFELRDMAQYFPTLGAAYQSLGQTGVPAVADLAAALQIVRKGTGDASSAATNLSNILQKIYAPRTIKAFDGMGVDLRKEMDKATKAGLTPIEAIAEVTNRTLKGDMSKLGDLFADAQVQQGLRPLMQNMKLYREIRAEAMKAQGVVEEDYKRRLETSAGTLMRLKVVAESISLSLGEALIPALISIAKIIEPIAESFARFAEANPQLTAAIVGTTAALIGFRVALAAIRFAGLLGRGGALSLLSVGYNTLGRSINFASNAAKGAVGLQTSLGAMSGMKLTGFQTITTGLRGIAMAIPGVAGLSGIFSAIGAALATVSAPIWAGVAIGAALVGSAGIVIYKYWDRISSFFSGVGRAISEQLAPAIQLVMPMLEPLAAAGRAIGSAFSSIGSVLSSTWEGIKSLLSSLFTQEVLSEGAKKSFENAGHAMMAALLEGIKAGAVAVLSYVGGIAKDIGKSISGAASNGINSVKSWFGSGDENPAAAPTISAKRARGGPVWTGGSFLVGEKAPEIFTPKTGGTITPVSKAGGGSFTFGDIIIQGASDPAETARRVRDAISDEINKLLRGAHSDMGARS